MAWCRQAPSHYLNQCWLTYMSAGGVILPQWVEFCRPECFLKIEKYVFILRHSLTWFVRLLNLTPKMDKIIHIAHSQYHGCCCPGDKRRQGINNHGIDRNIPVSVQTGLSNIKYIYDIDMAQVVTSELRSEWLLWVFLRKIKVRWRLANVSMG